MLEASAGTGKTYTIAALAARYVAEGTPLEQLLLVTFTRMATGELRDRVRERLVQHRARSDARCWRARRPTAWTPSSRLLATGPPEEIALRRDRLVRALADFDAATIATTHGFCQEVLGGLGVAGDLEPDARARRGRRRPARRGRRRPLRAPLHERRRRAADHARRGDADRARDGREPGRADRAARHLRRRAARRCARGWRRACATSSTRASARCRSSPTTTC